MARGGNHGHGPIDASAHARNATLVPGEAISPQMILTMQVIQQSAVATPAPKERPLPSIHLATWPNKSPTPGHEELYDDRGR